MRKLFIVILTLLFISNFVSACKIEYSLMEEVVIIDVMESMNLNSTCNITIVDDGNYTQQGNMTQNGYQYRYNAGKLPNTFYSAGIECDATGIVYTGECKFKVEVDEQMSLSIILMYIFSILVYIVFAYINFYMVRFNDEKIPFWLGILSSVFAMITFCSMIFIIYLNYIGTDISGILSINAYVTALVMSGVGSISTFMLITKMLDINDNKEKAKWEKGNKWD